MWNICGLEIASCKAKRFNLSYKSHHGVQNVANTLAPEQNGQNFVDENSECILLKESVYFDSIFIEIMLLIANFIIHHKSIKGAKAVRGHFNIQKYAHELPPQWRYCNHMNHVLCHRHGTSLPLRNWHGQAPASLTIFGSNSKFKGNL